MAKARPTTSIIRARRRLALFAVTTALLLASVSMGSEPARAQSAAAPRSQIVDYHHGKPQGHYRQRRGLRFHLGFDRRRLHRRHRRHHRTPTIHHGYGYSPRSSYDCREVKKKGYDSHGRRVLIGGTLCHDAYGRSYIVQGSRHIIRYY